MKKGSKIVIQVSISVADTFGDFILSRKAKGLSEKTLTTYNQHLSAIGKHLNVDYPIDELTKHYCAIFDADIAKNYDKFSPLMQMQVNSAKLKMSAGR